MFGDEARVTALVFTLVVVVSAVALFAGLDDLVTAERALGYGEAIPFLVLFDGVKNVAYVSYTAI